MPQLNVLLQTKDRHGRRLPWVKLVFDDLRFLRVYVSPKLDALQDPEMDPDSWWHRIREFPAEWRDIVNLYRNLDDDSQSEIVPVEVSKPRGFKCEECGDMLGSSKALAQHSRIKHKNISLPSRCLGDVTRCYICGTEFHTRLALVTHLCDKRIRSKVRGTSCGILYHDSNPTPLGVDAVAALNAKDRALRHSARKDGHTHSIAIRPAKAARSKVSKGIPSVLLSQVMANGVSRRLCSKTKPIIGRLKFRPRRYIVMQSGSRLRRVNVKSRVITQSIDIGPGSGADARRTRLRVKTSVHRTVYSRTSILNG